MDLIRLVNRNDWTEIKNLCDQGLIDVNARDLCGRTALMAACFLDQLHIVQLLCEQGSVDLELRDYKYKRTALAWAINDSRFAVVEYICSRGAKVNGLTSRHWQFQRLLDKQQFRYNLLVLVDHIQIELLRCVHSWI